MGLPKKSSKPRKGSAPKQTEEKKKKTSSEVEVDMMETEGLAISPSTKPVGKDVIAARLESLKSSEWTSDSASDESDNEGREMSKASSVTKKHKHSQIPRNAREADARKSSLKEEDFLSLADVTAKMKSKIEEESLKQKERESQDTKQKQKELGDEEEEEGDLRQGKRQEARQQKERKEKKKQKEAVESSRVVYLGHIPHGFFEEQMLGFFSQFGVVTRLRLSRSKKTGRSRGYAFIEFENASVAKVVAQAMDKYILFDHYLVCHLVEPAAVHDKMFAGAGKKFKPIPWRLIARQRHNEIKSPEQHGKVCARLVKNEHKKRRKLEALGIQYDFDGYEAKLPRKSKHMRFDGDGPEQPVEE